MKKDSCRTLKEIAGQFVAAESILVENLGFGNINDTYLVTADSQKFVLQRINGQVFPEPENVARNTAIVSEYLGNQLKEDDEWCFPEIITAENKKRWYRDDAGSVWRAQSYICNTRVLEKIIHPEHARQTGRCLGKFHQLLADLEPHRLVLALPGFHDTSGYLRNYDRVFSMHSGMGSEAYRFCSGCIEKMRGRTGFWDEAVKSGSIAPKIIHGDPKINNFLFREKTGAAVALIDLDTVGPGLILQDIGDGIRSCCCPSEEGNEDVAVQCDTDLFHSFLKGYLELADLNDFEKNHVFEALLLITFELGLRFFTDYLQGNIYFKVRDDRENLRRAVQQFSLAENIQAQESSIREIIRKVC